MNGINEWNESMNGINEWNEWEYELMDGINEWMHRTNTVVKWMECINEWMEQMNKWMEWHKWMNESWIVTLFSIPFFPPVLWPESKSASLINHIFLLSFYHAIYYHNNITFQIPNCHNMYQTEIVTKAINNSPGYTVSQPKIVTKAINRSLTQKLLLRGGNGNKKHTWK